MLKETETDVILPRLIPILVFDKNDKVVYANTVFPAVDNQEYNIFESFFYNQTDEYLKENKFSLSDLNMCLYEFTNIPEGSELYVNNNKQETIINKNYYACVRLDDLSYLPTQIRLVLDGKEIGSYPIPANKPNITMSLYRNPKDKYAIGDIVKDKNNEPYGMIIKMDDTKREVTVLSLTSECMHVFSRENRYEGFRMLSEDFENKTGKEIYAIMNAQKKSNDLYNTMLNDWNIYKYAKKYTKGSYYDWYIPAFEDFMGLSYIKNTFGPTPVDFVKLVKQMESSGQIEEVKTKYYQHDMTKYLPIKKPNLELLSARELEFIDSELEKHSGKSAKELSDFSHKDIPWIGAKDKEVLDYEAVFYRTPETSVREYSLEND